jgi:hypothetical protein
MRVRVLAVLVLLRLSPGLAADEVFIPGPDGRTLGAVPVEHVFLDRVEAALRPDGRAAAASVRHGRLGGASLILLEPGRPARVLLETGPEEHLSDPVWSPDGGRLAVVVRGPARRLPGERALRQGGAAWGCTPEGGCAPLGPADDLWRPAAFDAAGHLLAARILPGDGVALEPVRLGLADGALEPLAALPPDLALDAPEPWPAPPEPREAPLPPAGPPLPMPYIHQVYDTPNEFNGHWACGPTSTLMAIQHFGRLAAWPVTVDVPSPHTSDYGAYVSRTYTAFGSTFDRVQNDASGRPARGAYGWCTEDGAAWAWRMQDYARRHDLSSDFDGSATFAEVQAALDGGKAVALSTQLTSAGHIVTVKGTTADGRLVTNDPYGDKNQGYMNYQGEGAIYTWAQVGSKWFITVHGTGAVETDDAAFVAQSVPDGTRMLPGTPFTQRWTLRNSGTSTWTRAGNYLFTPDGEERYAAPEQILLPEGASVAPGQTWDWEVPMLAPAQPGSYRGYFRMDRYGVHRFGTRVYLDLVVDPWPDADGDGHRADTDCDDGDPDVYPGAPERCNGRDDDCDGQTDEGCAEEPAEGDGGQDGEDGSAEEDDGAPAEDGGEQEDGGEPAQDEAPSPDAGEEPGELQGGCGCAGGGGPGGFFLLLLFAGLIFHRVRARRA